MCSNEKIPMRVTGELCSACVSTGSGMMGWCENRLQGIIPVKLFGKQNIFKTWGSGPGLKTMSRCSCMRIGLIVAQDQYQKLCSHH